VDAIVIYLPIFLSYTELFGRCLSLLPITRVVRYSLLLFSYCTCDICQDVGILNANYESNIPSNNMHITQCTVSFK